MSFVPIVWLVYYQLVLCLLEHLMIPCYLNVQRAFLWNHVLAISTKLVSGGQLVYEFNKSSLPNLMKFIKFLWNNHFLQRPLSKMLKLEMCQETIVWDLAVWKLAISLVGSRNWWKSTSIIFRGYSELQNIVSKYADSAETWMQPL